MFHFNFAALDGKDFSCSWLVSRELTWRGLEHKSKHGQRMGQGIAQGTAALPRALALFLSPRRELCAGEDEWDTNSAAQDMFRVKETFSN